MSPPITWNRLYTVQHPWPCVRWRAPVVFSQWDCTSLPYRGQLRWTRVGNAKGLLAVFICKWPTLTLSCRWCLAGLGRGAESLHNFLSLLLTAGRCTIGSSILLLLLLLVPTLLGCCCCCGRGSEAAPLLGNLFYPWCVHSSAGPTGVIQDAALLNAD